MAKKGTKLELLKPFRILLNLLDKPEIGSAILEDVLVEVFKNLFLSYQHFNPRQSVGIKDGGLRSLKRNETVKETNSKENPMEELIKTGNLLFNTFEPYFMWQYIAKLLASCNRKGQSSEVDLSDKRNDPACKVDPKNFNDKDADENDQLEILDVIRLTDFVLNIVALVGF